MILPFTVIAIVIQSLALIVLLINKRNKQILDIIDLIIEIVYFVGINFAVIPFVFLNLISLSKFIAYICILIFELINIYILIFMIKRIIIYSEKEVK